MIPRCLDLHLQVHLLELQFMEALGQFTVGIEQGLDFDFYDFSLDLMGQVLVGIGFGQAGCRNHQANHDWKHVEVFHGGVTLVPRRGFVNSFSLRARKLWTLFGTELKRRKTRDSTAIFAGSATTEPFLLCHLISKAT